jgi:hypothetical protein
VYKCIYLNAFFVCMFLCRLYACVDVRVCMHLRFQVVVVASMKMAVFRVVALCSLVKFTDV